MEEPEPRTFSVDVAGLLEALTEQFPEPLLCVRELIQNAADAGARRIDVGVSHDAKRSLVRLSVEDDGRGMGAAEVAGYLTIGFSEKDPARDRGRFGIGKLSPFALRFERMIVETSSGEETHRIELEPDGSGRVRRLPAQPRGTSVRVYKACTRSEAERLSARAYELARQSCGSLDIPLYVNSVPVNHIITLPTPYVLHFDGEAGRGVVGVGGEPVRTLLARGIVLETGAPILGPDVSYILDAPSLTPTLSRNAVRRDRAFEELLQLVQAQLQEFAAEVGRLLVKRVEALRRSGAVVERALEPDDRAALEWMRARLLEPDAEPPEHVKEAPVLETADGDLVSASVLADVLRKEHRIPFSRVPRTREEIAGYVDRGVPVLLLYRDLEDFLERQRIETLEVDGLDDGVEVLAEDWAVGEAALASRPPVGGQGRAVLPGAAVAAAALLSVLVIALWWAQAFLSGQSESAPKPVAFEERLPPAVAFVARGAEVVSPTAAVDLAAVLSATVLGLSLAVAAGLLVRGALRRRRMKAWLRDEAAAPISQATGRRRSLGVVLRMLLHPVDFVVARGWSLRASGVSSRAIAGYRAFAPEPSIRAGARLDLDRLDLGFVDLVSRQGDPLDARMLIRREGRILLNRNHPTVRNLAVIAASDPGWAQVLLDALLATDGELARTCDPRQVEWDLVGRAPRVLAARRAR